MKLDKFDKAIGLAIFLVLLVAIQDYKIYPASFWGYANILGVIAAVTYYIFRKDLSEALAVFLAFFIMLHTGLEDFFYFMIGEGFPASMDSLYNHFFIGGVAKALGASTVTAFTLTVSVIAGGVVTYYVIRYLKKQEW